MGMYMASQMNRTPRHTLIGGMGSVQVVTLPMGGVSRRSLFDDFVVADYANALAESFEQPVAELFDGENVVDIVGRDDNPFVLPVDVDVWPTLAL